MKKYSILLAILLILPVVSAINIDVEQTNSDEVMILGLNQPAIFNLSIENSGATDNFSFFSFFGTNHSPKSFSINSGETKTIELSVYPPADLSKTGSINAEYTIKASDDTRYEDILKLDVIELKDAFKLNAKTFTPKDSAIQISLENKVNFNFNNLNVKLSSPFFELNESFPLSPYETKTFEIPLEKEQSEILTAGFYTITAEIDAIEKSTEIDGTIKFVEESFINVTEESKGFIVSTKTIKKHNQGNVPVVVETQINKNIITRLFTSVNPQPDETERQGSKIIYSWNEELKPSESLNVKVKTNGFLPLLAIILIVAAVLFVREYTKTDLKLRKKITFVKSKGGEFALKISTIVHARKKLDNVLVIDRVPPLLKLYHKFGKEEPSKIDESNKKIEWEFPKLEVGEKKIMTYIVYSKVGVLGKFALPRATALYERDKKMNEVESNRTYFVTEQTKD